MTTEALTQSHLRFGWLLLGSFALLGLVLEGLHGFKQEWYLLVPVRRSHLLLAHVHGVAFGLLHVLLAGTVAMLPHWKGGMRAIASSAFKSASLLIPIGFLGSGLFVADGRPGIAIVLLAPGILLLLIAALLTARATSSFA